MDDESRALIEQMLAEEQYYYGQDTIATLPTTSTTTINKRKPKKSSASGSSSSSSAAKKLKTERKCNGHTRTERGREKKLAFFFFLAWAKQENVNYITIAMISSASLPSHKTRWTSTEDELLRSAIVCVLLTKQKPRREERRENQF